MSSLVMFRWGFDVRLQSTDRDVEGEEEKEKEDEEGGNVDDEWGT